MTEEEACTVYVALGRLESTVVAVSLRKKLAPLLSIQSGSEEIAEFDSCIPCQMLTTAHPPSPDDNPPHPDPSACPRNGRALHLDGQWRASGVFARTSNVTSHSLISALASIHYGSLLESPASWIQSVKDNLSKSEESFDGNDLASIVSRCQALRDKEVSGQFLQMLVSIQLSFLCQELINADPGPEKSSILKFYCSHIEHLKHPPAVRTLQEWLAAGAKFMRITAGGTIYSLLILSGLGL
ncbi:hypothetical protein BKA83DRAFT_16113 [Pisolithus microcarpus]|nr:hypothetical protein BKA83DRAFT_16113 [Pisolithus microcarpus]